MAYKDPMTGELKPSPEITQEDIDLLRLNSSNPELPFASTFKLRTGDSQGFGPWLPGELQRHIDAQARIDNFCTLVLGEYIRKNSDYTNGDPNPFAAFDHAARELGLTREQVWAVFFQKHVRAVFNYCRSGELQTEDIQSRLLDIATYSAILYAMTFDNEEETNEDSY